MVLLAFLASVVAWDFINKGPADAAITRASTQFYVWARDEVDWTSLIDRAGDALVKATEAARQVAAAPPAIPVVAAPPAVEPILSETLDSVVEPALSGAWPLAGPLTAERGAALEPLIEAALDPANGLGSHEDDDLIGDSVFARSAILAFIAEASDRTGVSAAYLEQLALRESSFNPVAASDHSTARGLYQFIESTWLDVFARHGDDHDQAELARLVSYAADGRPTVADGRKLQQILDLRYDPKLATFLAAQFAGENRIALEASLHRPVSDAELYVAHFLGLSGARTLLETIADNPDASAPDLFPWAAEANRRYFYDRRGRDKSAADLYAALVAQVGDVRSADARATTLADS